MSLTDEPFLHSNITLLQSLPTPYPLKAALIHQSGPNWTSTTYIYTILSVCAFTTNGLVILTFICHRSLWTSFNVYLINLVTANFILTVMQNPLDIINRLYPGWWLSWAACTLYIYCLTVFEAGICMSHLLISFTRLWAVVWPHSYRHYHQRHVAGLACLGAWVYVHLIVLPGVVLDAVYYRLPLVVRECYVNSHAQWKWDLVKQMLAFNMALVGMLVMYPVIWWKRSPASRLNHSAILRCSSSVLIRRMKMEEKFAVDDGDDPTEESTKIGADSAVYSGLTGGTTRSVKRRSRSHAFTVLTVLTISVTICWTPAFCFYTLIIFVPTDNMVLKSVLLDILDIGVILFALQSVLDPILFVAALPELRQMVGKMLRRIAKPLAF